jgi:small subunit ribosomal protein S2
MENNTSLQQQLLEAGVHFGHLRKKWNPKMLPYIFAEKKGIHIIDLNKTTESLQEAAAALKQIAKSGKKVMFVGTKKQAKEIVTECARKVNMPFVTERWLGGMLTNFNTVRKSVKQMQSIEKMLNDGTFDSITKKERLTLTREKDKKEKVLGGIAQLGRVPAALFIVDIGHEHIALAEAKRLGITTFGMVDTNCDPNKVDFAIPPMTTLPNPSPSSSTMSPLPSPKAWPKDKPLRKRMWKIQVPTRTKRKPPACRQKPKRSRPWPW